MHIVMYKQGEPRVCLTGAYVNLRLTIRNYIEDGYTPRDVSPGRCPICKDEREILAEIPQHKLWG